MEFDRACSTVKKAFSFNYKKLQSRCEHGSICAEQETIDLINSNNTLFFGIAFDESSFFTNKVYVCTVRIATSTSIIERVLFLDTFTGRSGSDEITEYIEHELDELHLDMSKLVFITSDGDTELMNDGKVIGCIIKCRNHQMSNYTKIIKCRNCQKNFYTKIIKCRNHQISNLFNISYNGYIIVSSCDILLIILYTIFTVYTLC